MVETLDERCDAAGPFERRSLGSRAPPVAQGLALVSTEPQHYVSMEAAFVPYIPSSDSPLPSLGLWNFVFPTQWASGGDN